MSMNLVVLLYLIASVCFIQALKGLSHPSTARQGNTFGMIGMGIAVVTTIALMVKIKSEYIGSGSLGYILLVVGVVIGGAIGATLAKRIEMTKMPELVAAMHSLIGLAAVFIAIAVVAEPYAFQITGRGEPIPFGNRLELFIGTFVGAITFSGSVIAFGKLSGSYKFRLFQGSPVVFKGQHAVNLIVALVMVALGLVFCFSPGAEPAWTPFLIMTLLAFILGVLIIIPIGGADMPVVVSMLNSYSGWAAAGIGFSLNNSMLIIAGSLVGSSGAILSYIMCKAMNRGFISVIMGGFGGEVAVAAGAQAQRPVKSGSADDAAFLMSNADTVLIVPGYGLAVARAQHALKELVEKLTEHGVTVKYAIHPVAGRMPGHMNVLLAEAEVPYDQVFEMEDINSEFAQADVVLVLGANDVVNPAAKDPKSAIAGMPILEAHRAKTVIVNKRSMASGYAGLDNELFYMDKTMMVFGDAKKVVEDMVKAVE
ncbi:MAG: NAD(P)(+) transhydrogenase (Re/Si-specific) subunit beta [Oxalobacter sp.]|nr:MAG: NAD(P)(+) transhydrogenase (Re/Si-specific) subunit beta [Oxalobacter sp.]